MDGSLEWLRHVSTLQFVLSPSASDWAPPDKVVTGGVGTRASAVPLILGLAFVNTVITS